MGHSDAGMWGHQRHQQSLESDLSVLLLDQQIAFVSGTQNPTDHEEVRQEDEGRQHDLYDDGHRLR